MSYAARLIHDITLERSRFDDLTPDTYGQPVRSTSTLAVKGLVQPKAVNEVTDSRSAGVEVADHVIFLGPDVDLTGADFLLYGTRRFAVTGIRRFEFGTSPHLEVDARTVESPGAANDALAS